MEIDELVTAVQTLNADDAFRARLSLESWRVLAPYLARYEIRAGDLLIKQGDADRSMYLIGQGSMQVFTTGGPPGSSRVAHPARRRRRRRAWPVRRHAAYRQCRGDDAVRRLGPARPAHGRARAALAGASARVVARRGRRDGDPVSRHGGAPGTGHLNVAGARRPLAVRSSAEVFPRPAPAVRASRKAPACRRPPSASASSGSTTAPAGPPQRDDGDADRRQALSRRACRSGSHCVGRQRDAEQARVLQVVGGVVVGAVEDSRAAGRSARRAAPGRRAARAASARRPAPARGWPASASPRSPRAPPRWRRRRAALDVAVVDRAHDHRHRARACCTWRRIFSAEGVSW